jgi:hypothetical protein
MEEGAAPSEGWTCTSCSRFNVSVGDEGGLECQFCGVQRLQQGASGNIVPPLLPSTAVPVVVQTGLPQHSGDLPSALPCTQHLQYGIPLTQADLDEEDPSGQSPFLPGIQGPMVYEGVSFEPSHFFPQDDALLRETNQTMIFAIISAFCFCIWFGLVAFWFASDARRAISFGNLEAAERKLRIARTWLLITIFSGVLIMAFKLPPVN